MSYHNLTSRDKLLSFATAELEAGKQIDFLMLLIEFENDLTESIKNELLQPEKVKQI